MGYDVDRFVNEVNDGLLCCICRDVLEDPLQAPCEHAFCSACIMAWLVQHNICPEDRRPLTAAHLRPIFRYMKNDLDNLRIRCRNNLAGCHAVCSLESIEKHEEECEFHTEACPSVGCNVKLGRLELEEHLKVCEFRRKQCPKGCGLPILSTEDASHNCVAELRNSLELLRSELVGKMEEQRQELELRLDAQRDHMIRKQTSMLSLIENLKSQLARVHHDIHAMHKSSKRQEQLLEQAALEKQELLNVIATLQSDQKPSGSFRKRFFCRQQSLPAQPTKM